MNQSTELGPLLGYCGHLGKLYLEMQLRQFDVTPVQSRVLLYLTRSDGVREVTQRDLERELRLKAPTVNGVVDRLVEKGLITRTTSKNDARCRVLLLTDKGRKTAEQFFEAAQNTERLYCATLTEGELAHLREMLSRLIANLEKEVNKA